MIYYDAKILVENFIKAYGSTICPLLARPIEPFFELRGIQDQDSETLAIALDSYCKSVHRYQKDYAEWFAKYEAWKQLSVDYFASFRVALFEAANVDNKDIAEKSYNYALDNNYFDSCEEDYPNYLVAVARDFAYVYNDFA